MSTLTMQIKGATREEFAQVALAHGWEIDPVGRVAQMTERMMESRKLIGLGLSLLALLLLTVLGTVAVAIWGAPWEMFAGMGSLIAMLGGSHQTAQAAADRAPSYAPLPPMSYAAPPTSSSATPPWSPPPGSSTGASV